MYKRVDTSEQSAVEGFSYENKQGTIEFVKLGESCVAIKTEGSTVGIYFEDVPKLVLALQAAYDHKQGK